MSSWVVLQQVMSSQVWDQGANWGQEKQADSKDKMGQEANRSI